MKEDTLYWGPMAQRSSLSVIAEILLSRGNIEGSVAWGKKRRGPLGALLGLAWRVWLGHLVRN